VLAIGIVVDDAIVVVENVERNIEAGLSPIQTTYRAMSEVSGPIVAIALVLVAVFVPLAFISGLTGQFYRQFALTIAISTVISAINSLTLSPALAALLLRSHDAPKDLLTRVLDRLLGWFFRGFNRFFAAGSNAYGGGVTRVIGRKSVMRAVYLGLVGLAVALFQAVPGGFVPAQDKQYLVGFAQLPDGASLDRSEGVIKRMGDIAEQQPGVVNGIAFPGLSINGFTNSSNSGIVFVSLDEFERRTTTALSAGAIAGSLNKQFGAIEDAFIAVFPPPPVQGLGTIGGFKLQIEDRAGLGYEALNGATSAFLVAARKAPELTGMFTGLRVDVPQLYADIDRVRARQLGVAVTDVFDTLQIYLGSLYVNDFNAFAILIVEFARELEFTGRTPLAAAIEASRLRLRPILMTSMAFIMGVLPLVLSTGAGAEMRHAMGVAVFAGMIGVTAFGLFLTPVFYVVLRRLAGNRPLKQHGAPATPKAGNRVVVSA